MTPSEALIAFLKAWQRAVDDHGIEYAEHYVFEEATALDNAVFDVARRAGLALPVS